MQYNSEGKANVKLYVINDMYLRGINWSQETLVIINRSPYPSG